MSDSLTREACHAAAKWWSEFLTKKPGRDNGDTRESMAFVSVLEALTPRHQPTPEQVATFVQCLEDAILGEMEDQRRRGWSRPSTWLAVDYHPGRFLAEACVAADISPDRLPWKTCMWLDETTDGVSVKVAVGYGAAAVSIWPKSEVAP